MANWFVAFKVHSAEWLNDLHRIIPEGIKMFHHEDLHMTVAFLGAFNTGNIENVKEVIPKIPLKPFSINAQRFVFLPNQKYFTALCLDFSNPDSTIFHDIEIFQKTIYQAAKIPPDNRKFLPHITIGRPPRNISLGERKKIIHSIKKLPPLDITIDIDLISLYTWADNRHERLFKSVFDYNLNTGFN